MSMGKDMSNAADLVPRLGLRRLRLVEAYLEKEIPLYCPYVSI